MFLGFDFLFVLVDFGVFDGFLGGVGLTFGDFLFEFVNPAFDIGKFLGAGKEWVAFGANFHFYFFDG